MAAIFDSFPYDTRSMDETDWKAMMQWIRSDGILTTAGSLDPAGDSAVAPYANLTLQIYPGLAWIQGFYFTYTEDPLLPGNYIFSINENLTADPRIDLVVLRLDLSLDSIEYAVLEGVPAPSPIAPALTQNNVVWEMPIAQVDVAAGAAVINAGDITDLRTMSVQTVISPATFDLGDLGDVTIIPPATGQYLGYDNISGDWINKDVPAFDEGLNDLNDVVITGVTDGEHLVYDTGTLSWINEKVSIGGFYVEGNATTTPIAALNTPVQVGLNGESATTIYATSVEFAAGTNSYELKYTGLYTKNFRVTLCISAKKTAGGVSVLFDYYVAKNGTKINGSSVWRQGSGNETGSISTTFIVQLATNDVLSILVQNKTNGDDVVLENVSMTAE